MDQKLIKCKTCGEEKNETEFPFWNKKLNIRRIHCCYCHSSKRKKFYSDNKEKRQEQNRASYYRHKEERLKDVKEYAQKNRDKVRRWVKKSTLKKIQAFHDWKKTLSCSKCSENHPACLEFHHLDPTKKEFVISAIKTSKKKLTEELKKCIVLCSNCHRKLHYEEKLKTKN
jgi:hypothetical protein